MFGQTSLPVNLHISLLLISAFVFRTDLKFLQPFIAQHLYSFLWHNLLHVYFSWLLCVRIWHTRILLQLFFSATTLIILRPYFTPSLYIFSTSSAFKSSSRIFLQPFLDQHAYSFLHHIFSHVYISFLHPLRSNLPHAFFFSHFQPSTTFIFFPMLYFTLTFCLPAVSLNLLTACLPLLLLLLLLPRHAPQKLGTVFVASFLPTL